MSPVKEREPLGHHIVMQLVDSRVITSTEAGRRTVARVIYDLSHDTKLLAFGLADTHLHSEYAEDWRMCGRLAQRIGSSLSQKLRLKVPFAPAHREIIWRQKHLYRTFYYDLRQQDHHGINTDPFHEASSLPELLGLRVTGSYINSNVKDLLPRWDRDEVHRILGVESLPRLEEVSWDLLPAAASAGACLQDLNGEDEETVKARIAAIHAVDGALSAVQLAALLGRTGRWIRELRKRPVDAPLVEAIRLQLVLRQLKGGA
jgi:hypothetical protein